MKQGYTKQLSIKKPEFFSLNAVSLSHGWVNLAPFEWTNETAVLKTIINAGGSTYKLQISERNGKVSVFSESDGFRRDDLQKIRRAVIRILSMEFNMKEFIENCRKISPRLTPLARKGFGRLLRAGNPWEDAVKTLCTTNASWGFTQQMCRRLCEEVGNNGAFPTAEQVLGAGENKLKKIKLGYRAKYLMELAAAVAENRIHFNSIEYGACSYEDAYGKVKGLLGFGKYAQQHLLVLLGWHQCLPVDREVSKYLKTDTKRIKKDGLDEMYHEWGKNRFTAYKVERMARRQNWIGS